MKQITLYVLKHEPKTVCIFITIPWYVSCCFLQQQLATRVTVIPRTILLISHHIIFMSFLRWQTSRKVLGRKIGSRGFRESNTGSHMWWPPQIFWTNVEIVSLLYCNMVQIRENLSASSEIPGSLRTTWHFNPEDCTLHNHWCGNFKSNKYMKAGSVDAEWQCFNSI
jgi:hypothetical protein